MENGAGRGLWKCGKTFRQATTTALTPFPHRESGPARFALRVLSSFLSPLQIRLSLTLGENGQSAMPSHLL